MPLNDLMVNSICVDIVILRFLSFKDAERTV
jgi:hypothetical protein